MAEQVIIVPAADVATIDGTATLVAATDHKLVDANPNRESIIISADIADVWLAYGSAAAVVRKGNVVRFGGDPFVESNWKGEIHVISTGAAVVGFAERELGTHTLLGDDTGYTPSGPSDGYSTRAVITPGYNPGHPYPPQ